MGSSPVDRHPALRRVRSLLLRSPAVVQAARTLYRWPPLTRTRPFKRFVMHRVDAAERALPELTPRVAIETVLTCNARCVMCVHSERRMVGVMDMGLFERLIEQLAAWGVRDVCLSIYGEPMVDRQWLDRVRIVRAAGLRYSFFSNASMLTEDVATAMLELGGWTEVNFSVNGFSKAVYEAVMPPLKRERVYGNLARFLELKLAKGGEQPKVTVSCIALRENVHELREYQRWWSAQPGVDRVSIGSRTDWLGELERTDAGQAVRNRLRVVAGDTWHTPCPTLWSSMFVYHDGRVSPCCEDAAARKLIVGDANAASLREIFHGPALRSLREQHAADRRREHAVCGSCHANWPWV
ncbi:MAG: SPASM domain-containing protein [Deltaproteobacteria bacterium]|nr:SPASM domain-containing protein [Nannocystaceae bacterium]